MAGWSQAVVVKAVVRLQAAVRRSRARKAMVAYMQANGTLLSMPGTVQGKSGWYEYNENGNPVVVKYDVTDAVGLAACDVLSPAKSDPFYLQGEWNFVDGPLTRQQYYHSLGTLRTLAAEQGT
jgi:hypothetical protein